MLLTTQLQLSEHLFCQKDYPAPLRAPYTPATHDSPYRVSAQTERPVARFVARADRHRGRSHPPVWASPTVLPPRQPFRSRSSHYPPPPAAQSSSASPSAPHRSACRVSAAYPGAPARGSASRRDGSCGRPRRFALLFLCPASAGKRATAPVQPLSAKPNSVAVPSDTPANGWPSFALGKGAERTQSRVHCQNAGQCTALPARPLRRLRHTSRSSAPSSAKATQPRRPQRTTLGQPRVRCGR